MIEPNRPRGFSDRPICPDLDHELVPILRATMEVSPRCSTHGHMDCRDFYAKWERESEPVDLTCGGKAEVDKRRAPGLDDAEVEMLVVKPAAAKGPLPGIYFIHAGGMVMGNARWNVDMFLPFVADSSAVLVSVDYRLAPEHPDPTPIEDCYAGLAWTARNANDLGIDADHLIVAGVSAGGGLAAGVALMARDKGFPRIRNQVLICPMLDDRFQTPSSCMLDGEGSWDRNDNLYGWTALLADRRGGPAVSPYAAPARADNLAGLPDTYIDVGSAELFRDEVLTYATRLSQSGVSVDLHMWGGGFHGFDFDAPTAAISRDSIATRYAYVRRVLAVKERQPAMMTVTSVSAGLPTGANATSRPDR